MSMPVLIVEDTPSISEALGVLLELEGIAWEAVSSASAAQQRVSTSPVGVVIQDMNLTPNETSGADGITLFRRLRQIDPELPVLLMTAWTSLETAVELVREGAADYFAKPWNDQKLISNVRSLLTRRELQLENARLLQERRRTREQLLAQADLCGLIYASPSMHKLVSLAVQAAATDIPVLITGPNGVGKEILAQIVVANSPRHGQPFIKVNLGGLPVELLESELFGVEPGAFTGAHQRRIGRFEAAHHGTLFLDELANLPLLGQAKLLRVLESRQYERLGSTVPRFADVRLITATNANLAQSIGAGTFREDLYFRLNVLELKIPRLADRPEDILPIAESALPEGRSLSAQAKHALCAYDWPGNVRELLNRIRRALVVSPQAELSGADLSLNQEDVSCETGTDESARVRQALSRHEGNVSRAAEELGLSRQALYRRMEKLGIGIERRLRE
jgi:DNA-binding NtrC family response regulator